MIARRSNIGINGLGFMSVADCDKLSTLELWDTPECWGGGIDTSGQMVNDAGSNTVDIPGIYRDPGGLVSQQQSMLQAVFGTPNSNGAKPATATNYLPWLLGAVAVVAIVAAKR